MKRFVVTLALLLSLTTRGFAQVVDIPDPNLREALREALNLTPGEPITREAMLQLTHIRLAGLGVANLSGLQFATHLTDLHIGRNPISDITIVGTLTKLVTLRAHYCNIADVSPLAGLVKLRTLSLHGNRISDVTPLANLTSLRSLRIDGNRIVDHSPLDMLFLDEFIHDLETPCDMAPLPLVPRIENRNFPSLFTAWSDNSKWPRFDLIFCCPRFESWVKDMGNGYEVRTAHGSWDGPTAVRDAYLVQNPNMVFLTSIPVVWSELDSLPEDSGYWLRNANGEIEVKYGYLGLMDMDNVGWQQRMIDIAVTIDRCGLYDGIFIDGWGRKQSEGAIAILKGIRERVRDNFLIMVNTNDWPSPDSAPYVNGLFMESGFPEKRNTPEGIESGLARVENTLKWAAATLREPRIIGLEGSNYRHESPFTPRNMRWMRATTTMGLTFSDAYVSFPLRGGPFYDFGTPTSDDRSGTRCNSTRSGRGCIFVNLRRGGRCTITAARRRS